MARKRKNIAVGWKRIIKTRDGRVFLVFDTGKVVEVGKKKRDKGTVSAPTGAMGVFNCYNEIN